MSKERNPREYFEYNANFTDEIEEIGQKLEDGITTSPDKIAQSLFEIVKRTLETSVASSVEKKSILEGFAETIRNNTEKDPKTIEAQSKVSDSLAEKLQEFIQDNGTNAKFLQEYGEQLRVIVAATKPQERAQDIFCLPEEEKTPLELGEAFLDVGIPAFSAADRAIDPITRAIRAQILTKQRELIVTELVKNGTVEKEKIDDLNKFRLYFENEQNKETISKLLETDKNLKQALEQAEIVGYKNVHTEFSGRFTTMEWQDAVVENASGITTKQQIVRDADNREIATLLEATHKINPPHTVQKSDGTSVTIHNYRTIDFPIKLDNNGPMHLSLAVKDQHGRNIAANKAVYFTAHYDDDGKLVEVSSPHPVKFSGNSPDAVGYIEHGGQIYTLPVTQEKYKAMMQEVAKNLGQGVDISPSIEASLSVDIAVTSRGANPEVSSIKPGEQIPVTQENKVMMQEVSKNPGQGVDFLPSIDVPSSVDLAVTSGQKIEETQPYKGQENMVPTVKREEVKVDVPEYLPISEKVKTIEEKTVDAPEISQSVLIDSDVKGKVENIKVSLLKPRYISSPTRKSDEDIAKLVEDTSKSLEGKEFEKQKKDIGTTLEKLTPQEKIKLLQGLAKVMAEKRGRTLEQINLGEKKHNTASVRLITESKESAGEDGGIVKPQQRAEHVNVIGNVKLQMFLQNKINEIKEVSKKPNIVPKIQNKGGFQSM